MQKHRIVLLDSSSLRPCTPRTQAGYCSLAMPDWHHCNQLDLELPAHHVRRLQLPPCKRLMKVSKLALKQHAPQLCAPIHAEFVDAV